MGRIALMGGHGKVALLAAPLLTQDGHEVISVIRNPDHREEVEATGARALVADVERMEVDHLTRLFTGVDVVVWSAGAGGGDPDRTYAVDRDAAIRSMDAATAAGVRRYVMVSYLGAALDHGVPQDNPFFHYAEAKAVADDHLRRSGLGWAILMPSRLTDELDRSTLDPAPTASGPTARSLVAQVIRAVVKEPGAVRIEVPFTDGPVPAAEAISRLAGTSDQR